MGSRPKDLGNKQLRILYWNAEGIKGRKHEFTHILKELDVDVALLNETFLKPQMNFKLAGYKVYRSDRPTDQGGGTAVVVRHNLNHHEVITPTLTSIEANAIQLDLKTGPLRLIAAYKQPNVAWDTTDLDAILLNGTPTILAGDLNSKHTAWNSRVINRHGNKLLGYCNSKNVVPTAPTGVTYVPHNVNHQPDIMDISLLSEVPYPLQLRTIVATDSDHNPVLVTVEDVACSKRRNSEHINTKNINWTYYKETLTNYLLDHSAPLNTEEDIDVAIEEITATLRTAAKASRKPTLTKKQGDLPQHIKMLLQLKNATRKRWQYTRSELSKKIYNNLTKKCRSEIRKYQNETWNKRLTELSVKDNSLWQMVRALRNKSSSVPTLRKNDKLAQTDEEKANLLADHLEHQFSPNTDPQEPEFSWHVENAMNIHRKRNLNGTPKLISATEVRHHIRKLKNQKAPGNDGIPNILLKQLPPAAISVIVNIFNAALKLGYFPTAWKKAKIITILKPGKKSSDPASYRPISLLCGLAKLFEKLIYSRLMATESLAKAIPNEQFGFRSEHSTVHQLLRVVNSVTHTIDMKRGQGAIFLDIAQAFDRVWHAGLLLKLRRLKIDETYWRLLHSYLSNRNFYVDVEGVKSTTRDIKAGVPQGSILGPLMYLIYINDVPRTEGTTIALYADDTAIMSESLRPEAAIERLQQALNSLEGWFRKWRIRANPTKTVAIYFARQKDRKPTQDQLCKFYGNPIPWSREVKYLGVILDEKLTFAKHVDGVIEKVNRAYGASY